MEIAPFDIHSHFTWIRLGIALVWIVFGLVFKALGAVPRHRQIVARVVGKPRTQAVTSSLSPASYTSCGGAACVKRP